VGCVVIAKSGKKYFGCNVENASFGATICAERTAITQAIACGEKTIKEVYIVNSSKKPCAPCGICLQVIAEFGRNVQIVTADITLKKVQKFKLNELLTWTYDKSYLD
jgi:cytidine deaminase